MLIDYLPTQPEGNTKATHVNDAITSSNVHNLDEMGGVKTAFEHQQHELIRIVPHPRTLRKARENVKWMVITGTSSRRIRHYLNRWVTWWATTSTTWEYQGLLQQFIHVCWDKRVANYACALHYLHLNSQHTRPIDCLVEAAGRCIVLLSFFLDIRYPT